MHCQEAAITSRSEDPSANCPKQRLYRAHISITPRNKPSSTHVRCLYSSCLEVLEQIAGTSTLFTLSVYLPMYSGSSMSPNTDLHMWLFLALVSNPTTFQKNKKIKINLCTPFTHDVTTLTDCGIYQSISHAYHVKSVCHPNPQLRLSHDTACQWKE